MYRHADYHVALERIRSAPLTLTTRDFAVLASFNPADEQRGRAAQKDAQLALMPPTVTRQTKAAPPVARTPLDPRITRLIEKATLEGARHVGEALHAEIAGLKARVAQLELERAERQAPAPPRRASAVDVH